MGGGNQYLNIYSDYNNPGRNILAFDFVNNVYQEQTFTGADAAMAETWTFSFDYAGGQDPFGVANNPDSTSAAFIRVFDGAFNLLAEETFDTSDAPSTPMGPSPTIVFEQGEVSITFDPAWIDGGIIQFGFTTTSSGFEPTGVFYDNVRFAVPGGPIVPDSFTVPDGVLVSGGIAELAFSDNADLSIRKSFGVNRTEFQVKGVSPVDSPSVFDITFEGSVTGVEMGSPRSSNSSTTMS